MAGVVVVGRRLGRLSRRALSDAAGVECCCAGEPPPGCDCMRCASSYAVSISGSMRVERIIESPEFPGFFPYWQWGYNTLSGIVEAHWLDPCNFVLDQDNASGLFSWETNNYPDPPFGFQSGTCDPEDVPSLDHPQLTGLGCFGVVFPPQTEWISTPTGWAVSLFPIMRRNLLGQEPEICPNSPYGYLPSTLIPPPNFIAYFARSASCPTGIGAPQGYYLESGVFEIGSGYTESGVLDIGDWRLTASIGVTVT